MKTLTKFSVEKGEVSFDVRQNPKSSLFYGSASYMEEQAAVSVDMNATGKRGETVETTDPIYETEQAALLAIQERIANSYGGLMDAPLHH